MKRVVKTLAILAATALTLSQATPAFSQTTGTPTTSNVNQLPGATVAFQRQALDQLQQRSSTLAGGDTAKFTALLRQGLARLPAEVQKSERGLGGESIATITGALDPNTQPDSADSDPRLQSVVARTVNESRAFGIRMVGSTDAPAGSHPETVALLQGASQTGCSGVVVAAGAILTAAHCVCEFDLGNSVQQVAFGNDIKSPDAVAFTIPDKTRIFPSIGTTPASVYCSDYKQFAVGGHGRICDRDVALVQFDPARAPPGLRLPQFASKSDLDTAFDRISFPDHGSLLPIEVVGYGVTRIILNSGTYNYGSDGRKRYGRFTFYFGCSGVPPFDCAVDNGAYCMGGTEIVIQDIRYKTTDSCAGDSGGPAFVNTVGGEWRLAGLVSRAIRTDGDCGPGGVYSSLYADDIIGWLEKNDVSVAR
jgi:hypothetical protein